MVREECKEYNPKDVDSDGRTALDASLFDDLARSAAHVMLARAPFHLSSRLRTLAPSKLRASCAPRQPLSASEIEQHQ